MVQGLNKEYIFEKQECILKYKNLIKDKQKESNIIILAYCIMNNHAHFLIYSKTSEDLGKYMQKLNTAYGIFYNKNMKRVGFVYRNRYKSQNISSIKQLYNCLAYIHNNPVKAKMVKKACDYKYSSYNEFLSHKEIINEESIKLIFGNNRNYKEQFINMHYANKEENFLDIKDKNIEDYIKEVEKRYNKRITELVNQHELIEQIIKDARKYTDVTIRELAKILCMSKSKIGNYVKK